MLYVHIQNCLSIPSYCGNMQSRTRTLTERDLHWYLHKYPTPKGTKTHCTVVVIHNKTTCLYTVYYIWFLTEEYKNSLANTNDLKDLVSKVQKTIKGIYTSCSQRFWCDLSDEWMICVWIISSALKSQWIKFWNASSEHVIEWETISGLIRQFSGTVIKDKDGTSFSLLLPVCKILIKLVWMSMLYSPCASLHNTMNLCCLMPCKKYKSDLIKSGKDLFPELS